MTGSEIAALAVERGLLHPRGKTPAATMNARLYVELARNPNAMVKRVFEPGPARARRGSVRWTLIR